MLNTKLFNPLTSPGEVVSVFTSLYLSAGAPALGEAKGLIDKSKYYIYIENQFFISKSFEDQNKPYLVENKIALHLVNRILKSYRNKEKLRV